MNGITQRRALLNRKGFALSKTAGSSMRPLIWGGEHCVVVVPLEGEPRVGDMIMFLQGGKEERQVVHRVVKVESCNGEPVYITRGDNCVKCETVRCGDIVGRVTEVHRIGRFTLRHALPFRKFAVTDLSYRAYTLGWSAAWPVRRVYYLLRAYAWGGYARMRSVINRKK